MDQYYLFFVLALLAEIVGTVSGFGSSILFVPIASLFFDFKLVLGITAVFHVFSNLSKILLFRQGIDKRIALRLGIPAVVFVIIGALLTAYIPQEGIKLGMSLILVILAIYLLKNQDRKLESSNRNLYIGGTLSGFLAGLIGTGGAIRGLTLAAFNLEKQIFVATSALIDLGVDSSRAWVYISQGYFKAEHWWMIPFLIGVSLLGSALGKWVLNHTSQQAFRYLVLVLIIGSALFTILEQFAF